MRLLPAVLPSGSRTESSAGENRRAGACVRRPLLAAGAFLLVALLLVSAATPEAAEATGSLGTGIAHPVGTGTGIPNPIGIITGGIGSLLGGLGGDIAKLAVAAFEAIIKALFAPIAKFITTQLIGWVITVPDLTQSNVSRLEQTVEAMGGGLLGAVATISIIRYWAAGFAGGGDSGFSALEGLFRTVGAALFLACWPWLFGTAVHLTNLFTSSLMGSGTVVDQTAKLLAAGLGAGTALSFTPIGLFLDIAMAVAASLLFLGLLLMKVVVSASTILVFVGMPLAAVVWPVVPWVARAAMRAFAVCLIVPVLWALCFAAAGAATLNAISFNAPSALNTLLQPLVAIVLLYIMLKLPVHLARVAMLGAAPLGSGPVSRAVSHAAGSLVRDTARQHLPSLAGGQQETRQAQPESRTATRLHTAATLAGAAATGGAGAAAAAGGAGTGAAAGGSPGGAAAGGAASAAAGRAYTPPPSAQANAAGSLQNGLQTPAFAGREQDFANEKFEAEYREQTNPVSVGEARAALASLPENTQLGIGQLVSDHGAGAREHLAYQALGEWSPEERQALRTLAAASPQVRAEALRDAEEDRSIVSGQNYTPDGPDASDTTGAGERATQSPDHEPRLDSDPAVSFARAAGDPTPRSRPPAATRSSAPASETRSNGPTYDEAPAQRSLPAPPVRRSLPPPREPRGPNLDELFPNG